MLPLWIPVTLFAAFCQSIRVALQKYLKPELSSFGITYCRYIYGLPLAVAYIYVLAVPLGISFPQPNVEFWGWLCMGALAQIIATALLVNILGYKNLVTSVAYMKTEIIQTALFGFIFLGEALTWLGLFAVFISMIGVILMSVDKTQAPLRALRKAWKNKVAIKGIACGGLFAVSSVSFRGASLALGHESVLMAAGYTLLCAVVMQTFVLTAYLFLHEPGQIGRVLHKWKPASLVGIMGVAGSIGWFTALTLQTAAYVRTLGLVSMAVVFLVSTFYFKERPRKREMTGVVLLIIGIAIIFNIGE